MAVRCVHDVMRMLSTNIVLCKWRYAGLRVVRPPNTRSKYQRVKNIFIFKLKLEEVRKKFAV